MSLSVRENSQLADLVLVKDIVSQDKTAQYCQIAVIALLVYDSLITLDKEAEYFWGASFRKPVTLIYFINRYMAIFGSMARFFGKFSDWSDNITTAVVIASIDCILTIRVLAFYSQHKAISTCLIILLALEAGAKFIAAVYGTWVQHQTSDSLVQGITVCASDGYGPTLVSFAILDWSLPMSFGLILMGLALFKAAEYWKISAGFKGFELVKVLIRDQAVYFSAMIAFCALNIAWYKLAESGANKLELVILQQAGRPAFLSILGSRMLFNLKEAGERGLNEGTNYWPKSLSNIEFCDVNAPGIAENSGTGQRLA